MEAELTGKPEIRHEWHFAAAPAEARLGTGMGQAPLAVETAACGLCGEVRAVVLHREKGTRIDLTGDCPGNPHRERTPRPAHGF